MKPVMYGRRKSVCQIKPSQSRSLPVEKIHYFLIIVKDANLCSCLLRFVTWLLDFTEYKIACYPGQELIDPGQQLSDPG